MLERLKSEPAVLVAVALAIVNWLGVEVDLEQVATLRGQILETLALLLGGGLVRQTVFSRKRHETDVTNAEAGHRGGLDSITLVDDQG